MGTAVYPAARITRDFCVYQRSFAFVQNAHVYAVSVTREEVHCASGHSCRRQGSSTTSIHKSLPKTVSAAWGKAHPRYDPTPTKAFWFYAYHPGGGIHGRDDSNVCQPWRAVWSRHHV